MELKKLSDEQLQYGIDRCKARLSGVMPRGVMTIEIITKAELDIRGILKIDF